MKLCIIGAGGFGREVASMVAKSESFIYAVQDEYHTTDNIHGRPVVKLSDVKEDTSFRFVIAIGNPIARAKVTAIMPSSTDWATIIDPRATIGPRVSIGPGSIICAGAVLTCDINIESHVQVNLNSTIGHNSVISSFATIAPGANISGSVSIGERCYIGTGSCIREGVTMHAKSTLGMGGALVASTKQPGIYLGVPARRTY